MSPIGIGGSGILGMGFETVVGTRVAATKWMPIRSESINDTEAKQVLAPIRGVPTASHVKRGYKVIEGDITMEVTSDTLPYLLYLARVTPAKAGVGPYTYTFVPTNVVQPTTAVGAATRKTATIHIERAGQAFEYLGCSVTSRSYSIDNGDLIVTAHIMGLTIDTTQAVIVPTFSTYAPFGPGDIAISIPNTAERADIDTFTININDNGEALNRIRQGGSEVRGPTYMKWGEREVGGTFAHDFADLTEYNVFNDNDFRTLRVNANHGADDDITIDLANIISNNYPVNLGGMGDLIRADVDFRAIWQGSAEYTETIITDENIAA